MLVKPPRDFEQYSLDPEDNGPLGLANFDDPNDRRIMRNAHFTGGYEHTWKRIGAPDIIIKIVLEFDNDAQAASANSQFTSGIPPMPGDQLPGAVMGHVECGCSILGEGIAYHKGNRIFIISVGTTTNRFIPAETTALALEQFKTN